MAVQKAPVLAQLQPQQPLNIAFQLKIAVTGVPVHCPYFWVPPGATVTLRPVNGAILNAAPVYVSDNLDALAAGSIGAPGTLVLPPGADVGVNWPCENTGEIYAVGGIPDGLLVTVQINQVG